MATNLKTETPADTVITQVRAVKERLALQMGCNIQRIASHAREGQRKRQWLVVNRRSVQQPAAN
ncbi:MAG: hypothetical protein D4R65_07135 [Verrucomicrobiaceae bacterium]|nr:MAG: hypothetical protein D4R65_07135 [Verrucomicrobiaceae bacterium]